MEMTSLEIINEFIKNIEDTMKEIKSGPWYDLRLLDLNKFKKIKQDLEKYNCAIYLLNQLFEYVDYRSYCFCDIENDEEEIMFQLKTKEYSMDIPYEVYSLMRDLEYGILKEVGDPNE